jgi:hypothetical protein
MKRAENQLDAQQVLSVVESYSAALDMLDDYDHQTIMIAESKPEEKEMMVNVIMNCLI